MPDGSEFHTTGAATGAAAAVVVVVLINYFLCSVISYYSIKLSSNNVLIVHRVSAEDMLRV